MTEDNKSGIRSLVGRKMEKNTKFLGMDIKIKKLLVSEVLEIQRKARTLKSDEVSETDGLDLLKMVIRLGAEGGTDMTDEEFSQCPIDELSNLSDAIMQFSGLGKDQGK